MNRTSLLNQLKSVYASLLNSDGEFYDVPHGYIFELRLSKDKLKLLKNIIRLTKDTDILCEYSKYYLKNRDCSMSSIVEQANYEIGRLNQLCSKEVLSIVEIAEKDMLGLGAYSKGILKSEYDVISLNNVVSRIQYDNIKLERLLGSNIITDILSKKCEDLGTYVYIVNSNLKKLGLDMDIRKQLVKDIPTNIVNGNCKKDFIKMYGSKLAVLVNSNITKVYNELISDKEFVGYFNYLLCTEYSEEDSETVVKDREALINILNGNMFNSILGFDSESKLIETVDKESETDDKVVLDSNECKADNENSDSNNKNDNKTKECAYKVQF